MGKERLFKMKRFEVSHSKSANKVGVDGVLIGAWARIPQRCRRILDAGCGCGLIALMMAQRATEASVLGIDIHPGSLEEAKSNAGNSDWNERITISCMDFQKLRARVREGLEPPFDLIVSNPPFFHSGVDASISARMQARHAGSLSPEILVELAYEMLSEGGELAFIAEYSSMEKLIAMGTSHRMEPVKACVVKGNRTAEPKRVMLQFRKGREDRENVPEPNSPEASYHMETLSIETTPGVYTPEYIELCKDFYLKF